MSQTYKAVARRADRVQKERFRPRQARRLHLQAVGLTGSPAARVEHLQQAGVCAGMSGAWGAAEHYLNQACALALDDYRRGSILRDLSLVQARRRRGVFKRRNNLAAIKTINQAAKLHRGNAWELATDQGYLGRIMILGGNVKGCEGLAAADKALAAFRSSNPERFREERQRELYNKLHLACAYSRVGQKDMSYTAAAKSLRLAGEYGSSQHRLRARLIMVGGWRLEAAVIWCLASARRLVRR